MGDNSDMTVLSSDPNDPNRSNKVPNQEPAPSGFQEAPRFETPPAPAYSEPPRPTEVPTYGEVVEPPKKKNNKKIWIIVAIIVAVICCCCIVGAIAISNLFQNYDIDNLEDLLDEFSQIIRLAPAFI